MAEEGKDFRILGEMLITGLAGYEWPKVTHLIVIIKDKDGKEIYNKYYDSSDHDDRRHTEIKMLNDNVVQNTTGGVYITMISNYSPCCECAAELINFYDNKKGCIQNITIQFSRLYKTNEEKNKNGLQKLNKAGITLEAMTEKSWFDVVTRAMTEKSLFDVVTRYMFKLDPNSVRKRDDGTRENLKELLCEGAIADAEPVDKLTQGIKDVSLGKTKTKKHSGSSKNKKPQEKSVEIDSD